ncbi:hypothetical protein [Burkholderia pseudomallei]|uniref:hypothetical protein n=1 Tax=Burkholderia pseudomallei TaxID=28450 RepID=UPI001E646DB7|nr:hypothetical protein [Burkholderia pseudomallei]
MAADVDHAEARDAQAGVDAEDSHGETEKLIATDTTRSERGWIPAMRERGRAHRARRPDAIAARARPACRVERTSRRTAAAGIAAAAVTRRTSRAIPGGRERGPYRGTFGSLGMANGHRIAHRRRAASKKTAVSDRRLWPKPMRRTNQ